MIAGFLNHQQYGKADFTYIFIFLPHFLLTFQERVPGGPVVRVRLTPTARFSAKRQRTVPWEWWELVDSKLGSWKWWENNRTNMKQWILINCRVLLLSSILPENLAWWPQYFRMGSLLNPPAFPFFSARNSEIYDTVIKLTQKGCSWFGQNDMKLEVSLFRRYLCRFVKSLIFGVQKNYGQVWEESPSVLGGESNLLVPTRFGQSI